jgi:hypothetical protein
VSKLRHCAQDDIIHLGSAEIGTVDLAMLICAMMRSSGRRAAPRQQKLIQAQLKRQWVGAMTSAAAKMDVNEPK